MGMNSEKMKIILIGAGNLATRLALALQAKGLAPEWVYSRTVGNKQSYVTPIPDQTLEMVNTYFNPYLEDIKLNELDILYS